MKIVQQAIFRCGRNDDAINYQVQNDGFINISAPGNADCHIDSGLKDVFCY